MKGESSRRPALTRAHLTFLRLSFLIGILALLCAPSAGATDAIDPTLQIPEPGDNSLHILTPTVLELVRVNTKTPNPGALDSWDWVDTNQDFTPPDMSSIRVVINGQTNSATVLGFKRRPIYAPQATWDLRIGNYLYLQLNNPIADGQSVQVINNGTLWRI